MNEPVIIFVGMNNKPGFTPLDPLSKTGKLINIICFELIAPIRLTNLFNLDHWPEPQPKDKTLVEWMLRARYKEGDIIVPLGAATHYYFRGSKLYPIVYLGHPSGVWSNEGKIKYASDAVSEINSLIF